MVKKIFAIVLLFTFLLGTTNSIFAEDQTGTSISPTLSSENPGNLKDQRQKRETELRAQRAQKLQEFKDRLDKRQAELKDKIATREGQLKERLAAFKDKRKAQTAENVSKRLNDINKNRVADMTRNVNAFDEILTKVKARTAEAKANGKDVTSIETTITAADLAIANARSAITTQSGKDYTLTATDETKIKEEAKAKRDSLEADLKSTHDKVKAAREAVGASIKAGTRTPPFTVTPTI